MARNRIDEDLRAPESADICVGVVGGIPRAAAHFSQKATSTLPEKSSSGSLTPQPSQ
jgi:hypothetical protein